MSVVVDWLVKYHAIIWESTDRMTGYEMDRGNARVRKLIEQAQANGVDEVHIFVDAFRYQFSPLSIWAMYQSFSYLRGGGYGWHVVCASDSMVVDLCRKFTDQFSIGRIVIQKDVEAGLLFMQGKDKRLGDLVQAYREWVRKPHHPPY